MTEPIGSKLLKDLDIDRLEKEVLHLYKAVDPPSRGFTYALYGYMMGVFSRIDLVSTYWRGPLYYHPEKTRSRM